MAFRSAEGNVNPYTSREGTQPHEYSSPSTLFENDILDRDIFKSPYDD